MIKNHLKRYNNLQKRFNIKHILKDKNNNNNKYWTIAKTYNFMTKARATSVTSMIWHHKKWVTL